MKMTMEVAEDNTSEIIAKVKSTLELALTAVGLQAESYAKRKCPVDTGRLRGSIVSGVEMWDYTAYIGTNVYYAPYVEMGTSRTKEQPFLKPAVNDHANEYRDIFEYYLTNA